MHFTKALIFAASVAGFVSAAAVADSSVDETLAERDAVRAVRMFDGALEAAPELQKRACRNNGCTCYKGTKQGQYCYNDYNKNTGIYCVQKAGSGHKANDRYECNPQGGCCDYGPSSVCN